MSAFLSVQDGNGVAMITDGASYDSNGVVLHLGRKVTVGKVAPIAVTTRGNHGIGKAHQQRLCDAADRLGVDAAMAIFEEALPEMATDPEKNGLDYMHWHILAVSETLGPIRWSAHNMPFAFADGEEPFALTSPTGTYAAGNKLELTDVAAAGVKQRRFGEGRCAHLERYGADIMEAMRRKLSTPLEGESGPGQYIIGGQCDFTLVTAAGATVRTLRTWPDRIGEVIQPAGSNVVPLSRQQRRAMERQSRRA